MKSTNWILASVFALVVIAGPSLAEEAKAVPSNPEALFKALAQAGTPGPEHAKLQPFVGEWNVIQKVWIDPSQPPMESKGTIEGKWILGNRFVQGTISIDCHGKTVEGMCILGYDVAQKKFSKLKVCALTSTSTAAYAVPDPSGKKFDFVSEECCPLTGVKMSGREEMVIEGNDKIVATIYKTMEGKEVKLMELVATRK